MIERIIEIDQSDDLYREYLRQPYFHDGRPNEFFSEERFLNFFDRIFQTPIQPVGTRKLWFQVRRWIPVKQARYRPPASWTGEASAS